MGGAIERIVEGTVSLYLMYFLRFGEFFVFTVDMYYFLMMFYGTIFKYFNIKEFLYLAFHRYYQRKAKLEKEMKYKKCKKTFVYMDKMCCSFTIEQADHFRPIKMITNKKG